MIYLDTSVALAALFAEPLRPPDWLWREALVSGRLLEYELGVRINARGAGPAASRAARTLLDGVALLELAPADRRLVAAARTLGFEIAEL